MKQLYNPKSFPVQQVEAAEDQDIVLGMFTHPPAIPELEYNLDSLSDPLKANELMDQVGTFMQEEEIAYLQQSEEML